MVVQAEPVQELVDELALVPDCEHQARLDFPVVLVPFRVALAQHPEPLDLAEQAVLERLEYPALLRLALVVVAFGPWVAWAAKRTERHRSSAES